MLDLLATLSGKDLSVHTGEDVIKMDSDRRSGVVHTVRLVNGVAVRDCRGFTFTGNCKHVRNVLRRTPP